MLTVSDLCGGYGNGFQIKQIDFEVNRGEFFGIIGPNGSGKTTLVKMISGILPYERGTITISGEEIVRFRPKQLAKKIAVLPQLTHHTFQYTVGETVALGRYAHQSTILPTLSPSDKQIIEEVMVQTDVKRYEHVTIDRLSGGEKQRVFLAQALVQQPEIIILDEPTNHLDLAYQKELLDLLKKWTIENQLTIVAIFHDLNIASLYCERLLMMHEGKVKICGTPHHVLQHELIFSVYKTEVENRFHPQLPKPQVMLVPEKNSDQEPKQLGSEHLIVDKSFVTFSSPLPLKAVATNIDGEGFGWYNQFVHYYQESLLHECNKDHSLKDSLLDQERTLITYNDTETATGKVYTKSVSVADQSMFLILHQADVAYDEERFQQTIHPLINPSLTIWVMINGTLAEDTFLRALVTIAEARTIALYENGMNRSFSAIGNSSSIVVAATQTGIEFRTVTEQGEFQQQLFVSVKELVQQVLQRREVKVNNYS